jgi:hypothetical protein
MKQTSASAIEEFLELAVGLMVCLQFQPTSMQLELGVVVAAAVVRVAGHILGLEMWANCASSASSVWGL